jgi:hypothetical protein
MKQKVYISTPLNARTEPTVQKRYEAAKERCQYIINVLSGMPEFKETEFITTFDINPWGKRSENQAMGNCIAAVMDCDLILMDYGWNESRGCNLEYYCASIYDIPVQGVSNYGVMTERDYMRLRG